MKNLFIILLLTFISCKETKHLEKSTSNSIKDSISLSRSACYGTCPVYSVQMFRNGQVLYTGQRFVANIGSYQGTLSSIQVDELFSFIDQLDWNAFPETYPIDNVDFPQFSMEVQLGKLDKNIKANSRADENLIELSKKMDELIAGLELKSIAE